MGKRLSILRILSANIFLLALLVQPVHQLQHLTQQIEHKHEFHHYENCKHAGHVTENDHCKFCDFTFSPSDGFVVQHIEIPLSFTEIFKPQNVEVLQHFVSQYVVHKQLRAPPVYA